MRRNVAVAATGQLGGLRIRTARIGDSHPMVGSPMVGSRPQLSKEPGQKTQIWNMSYTYRCASSRRIPRIPPSPNSMPPVPRALIRSFIPLPHFVVAPGLTPRRLSLFQS